MWILQNPMVTEQFYLDIQGLNLTEFYSLNADIISGFYPLHPLVAMALPELCVRFAQNDRTLFAFLCGGQPRFRLFFRITICYLNRIKWQH